MKPLVRIAVTGALLIVTFATTTLAAGIDVSWDDCGGGTAPAFNKNFNCTGASTQTYSLIFQFKTDVTLPNFVGIRIDADLYVAGGPLQPFWHYETGGCNGSGVSISDALPAPCEAACYEDVWGGDGSNGFEGIAAYLPDNPVPGRGRFILGVARASSARITAGTNYYACHLRFNTSNRLGCEGCSQPAALVFTSATLESNDGTPFLTLSGPDKYGNCVGINSGGVAVCGITEPGSRALGLPPCVVPTLRESWGRLKSMYR